MREPEPIHEPAPGPPGASRQCTVLVGARKVLVDGREARLGGRAFDLLMTLLLRQGEVVPKQALHDAVWPGLAVTPNNLDVQIWALRRCLGTDAIRTVARRGYVLSPAVPIRLEDGAGQDEGPSPPDTQPAVLLARLAARGQLALVGGDVQARARLCDALCALHARRAQGAVWRLQAGAVAGDTAQGEALQRLERVGGLVVLAEGDAAQRGWLLAWARRAQPAGRLLVLTTSAQAVPGVDVDLHRLDAPIAEGPVVAAAGPRQGLRWQPRPARSMP